LKKRSVTILLIIFTLVSLLYLSPLVSAKIRRSYLQEFIFDNKISESEGFTNSIDEEIISYEATFYSLEILEYYSLKNQAVDSLELANTLRGNLSSLLNNEEMTLSKMFFILSSLEILGYESNLEEELEFYLNQTEFLDGGFGAKNTSSSPNLISSYFAINNYELIEKEIPNKQIHLNWILNCSNSDGGFGGDPSIPSTVLNTYYGILSIDKLNESISLPNLSKTLAYLKSFYSLSGGYLPDLNSNIPIISQTYYAIKSISLLNSNQFNDRSQTIDWILDQQNLLDGGFSDSVGNTKTQYSSVSSSYFAFETLLTLSAEGYLSQDVGIVQFNWIILLFIFVGIAVAVGLGFFLWKKSKI